MKYLLCAALLMFAVPAQACQLVCILAGSKYYGDNVPVDYNAANTACNNAQAGFKYAKTPYMLANLPNPELLATMYYSSGSTSQKYGVFWSGGVIHRLMSSYNSGSSSNEIDYSKPALSTYTGSAGNFPYLCCNM